MASDRPTPGPACRACGLRAQTSKRAAIESAPAIRLRCCCCCYLCVYFYAYIYIYSIYTYTHIYIYTYIYIHIHIHIYIYIYIYIYLWTCIFFGCRMGRYNGHFHPAEDDPRPFLLQRWPSRVLGWELTSRGLCLGRFGWAVWYEAAAGGGDYYATNIATVPHGPWPFSSYKYL